MLWPDDDHGDPDPSTLKGLRDLVEVQRDTVAAIATGSSMDSHRAAFARRRSSLRPALQARGLDNPFIWPDVDGVWAWAKQWGTYAERRRAIAERVTPLLDQVEDLERNGKVVDWGGTASDWADLEARVAGLRQEIDHASELDDFQDVGRRSREILIDVVDLVFSEAMVPSRAPAPKASDAKARFDLVIGATMAGASHAELRKVMRAVWDLTQKVTHGGVTRVDAFAAAQGTLLIVRTLAELQTA